MKFEDLPDLKQRRKRTQTGLCRYDGKLVFIAERYCKVVFPTVHRTQGDFLDIVFQFVKVADSEDKGELH